MWCALCAPAGGWEARSQYCFDSWTTDDGLSHKAVRALLQTRDGYLRMTTADGLSSDRITTIFQDREGSVWVGTLDYGLNCVTRRVVNTYSTANGLAADNTYPVYGDAAGAVWVGGWGGLTKIGGGRFTHYTDKDGFKGLPMSLFQDREGTLWIGAFSTLTRLRDGRFETMAGGGGRNKIDLPDPATLAITQDREAALWFGTVAGPARYQDGASTSYTTADGLPDNYVQTVREGCDGTLWVGTRGGLARAPLRLLERFNLMSFLNHMRPHPVIISATETDERIFC